MAAPRYGYTPTLYDVRRSVPDPTTSVKPMSPLTETNYQPTTYPDSLESSGSRDSTPTDMSKNPSSLKQPNLIEEPESTRMSTIGRIRSTDDDTNTIPDDIGPSQKSVSEDTTNVKVSENPSRPVSVNLTEQTKLPSQSRLPLKESLGVTGCATIIGGAVAILAILAFLTLLWFGHGDQPEAANATRLWRLIALHDWMTRAITITSLLLRLVVSLQVALCTSMTAALILEKRSARKSDIAYLSIARSVNDGPLKMFQLLLSSRSWSLLASVELWLFCLLTLVMLALQFSSTLLLSDLHQFVVVGDVEVKSVATFGKFPNTNEMGSFFYEESPVYAMFGEERSSHNTTPDSNGFSDTGALRRGYLPFLGSENRTSVRKYRGPTLVSKSRTVCVPPQIKGHILTKDYPYEAVGIGHIVGTLDYGESLRQAKKEVGFLCSEEGCESVAFDCR